MKETQILNSLRHKNIVTIFEDGLDGVITNPSGSQFTSLKYILMEYVAGGVLYDYCEEAGGFGEQYTKIIFD